MKLFSMPPDVGFLEAVAAGWLADAKGDALAASRGLILLPTKRSARALAAAFLDAGDGRPMLLPRIGALGALDEAPLALAGALSLPPAVEPAQRLAVLTRLILAMKGAAGAPRTADRAWLLAIDLASLLDEAERAGIDLEARLPDAAEGEHAEHWNRTVEFLKIVTRHWPAWLEENGLMNPAARQVALLDAQATAWAARPPDFPVMVAGTTGGIAAVARLLAVVARLPQGRVVLPGLDFALDDTAWAAVDEAHPQAGLRRLLERLDATRGDVQSWAATRTTRPGVLSHALLPAACVRAWRDAPIPLPTTGFSILDAADQQEEAAAIALILRDALEKPGTRAALVTPDRELAARVTAELLRYGVIADDSAGEKLSETPPAVFLRLVAQAVAEHLAPVPLLALLKHPFAAAGQAPAATRSAARLLELACLRGPRPTPGLPGLRRAIDRALTDAGDGGATQVRDLLARLEKCLEPLLRLTASVVAAPADLLAVLVIAAEALAATDEASGPAVLWGQEEGEALATRLGAMQAALPVLADEAPENLPGLLDAMLEGEVVRSRRALRGRGGVEHPRVFIWGLLEARLQSVDVMVLGGLAEGIWPPATDPGPWMSRPMRARVGLPSPEEQVGQAAHDFVMACCAAPVVVLSCPRRREGAPAVPSRWLVRLDALLRGAGAELAKHPAAGWARLLDQPAGAAQPVTAPRPCPPVAMRPRRLRVTEIETWLRDPFAIYAKHVLKLEALKALDESADAADYGNLVHAGLHRFLDDAKLAWPADAAAKLRRAMARALVEADLREALSAWWEPRLGRIADWVAAEEVRRRCLARPVAIGPELVGKWRLEAENFELRGRADRIERFADGRLFILDYKTGAVPSDKDVIAGLAPQLPLEAAMAADGAFGPDFSGPVGELVYWHLTGGFAAGKTHSLLRGDTAKITDIVAEAREKLPALIRRFDDPDCPYLSQPHPGRAPRYSDYAQLARVAEWAAAEDEP